MSRICPRCQTENRDRAQYCMGCRSPLASTATPVRYCPSGRHPMDPGWTDCPYCNSGAVAATESASQTTYASQRLATVAEGESVSPPPPLPVPPSLAPPPVSGSAPASPPPAGRRTLYASPEDAATVAMRRRIVGLLVTYTWKAEGEIFPVREGRNFVGSSPECDVSLPADPRLSGRHATILARQGEFWIDDAMSLNGTRLDGEPVDEKRRLPNYATLETGGTVWRFVMIERVERVEPTNPEMEIPGGDE